MNLLTNYCYTQRRFHYLSRAISVALDEEAIDRISNSLPNHLHIEGQTDISPSVILSFFRKGRYRRRKAFRDRNNKQKCDRTFLICTKIYGFVGDRRSRSLG